MQALRARPIRIADDIRPFSLLLVYEARHARPGLGGVVMALSKALHTMLYRGIRKGVAGST
ncbi:hypothetical protein ADK59_23370 [Streptomyces sp. XY332]|nr:hypothetical protein ADK59_23370 [Streptomyces sp. XY332]